MRTLNFALILLALLFQSCGLWRQSRKDQASAVLSSDNRLTFQQFGQTLVLADQAAFQADSLTIWYQLEIIPKGVFSFSADSGFKGEAGSLKLKGFWQEQKQQQIKTVQAIRQDAESKQQINQQARAEVNTRQQEKKPGNSVSFVLVLLVMSLVALYAFYRLLIK